MPASAATRSPSGARTLFRCYSWLAPYWHLGAGGLAAMLAADGISLLNPLVIRAVVDRGIGGGDLGLAARLAAALVGLAGVRGVLTFLQGRLIETGSQGVACDLRQAIYDRLAALSFSWHDRSETGQLLSRAVQDVDRVRFLTGRATFRLLDGIVLAVATLATLFALNPRLALLGLATMPFLAVVSARFGSRQRRLARALQESLGVLTARLEQNLRGIRIVKAFAQEGAEISRFEEENGRWASIAVAMARNQSFVGPLMSLISSLGIAFTLWYGGRLAISGSLTLGDLVAFTTYLGQLAGPVRLLGMIVPAIGQAISSGERVFEILDARSEVVEAPGATPLVTPRGRVEFQDVSFAYFNRYPVLREVSFVAEPGQVVALLGSTGSGKSTIVNLIPRFYDATGGRVLVDGRDVRELTLASLRGTVGIVLQETTLFATTIRENILFGVAGADEATLERAARLARAHDFIRGFPDGYDTRVGERGASLSGGQKQRIAIARAIAKDPRILILDDATSSVDTVTEEEIRQAMDNLMRDRTTFVIAHRISTIRRADLILLLEGGRIVARGTHEDLLGMSPSYADVVARQALGAGET